MSRRRISRVYLVDFNNQKHLVKAYSQVAVAKHLVGDLLDRIVDNTRTATTDDVIELMKQGVEPVDLTAEASTSIVGPRLQNATAAAL